MKELFYPSTYHAIKAGPCRVGVCKHDGVCGKCKEYGELRRYAARDTDRIALLRALVKEMEDALQECVQALEIIYNEECTGYGTQGSYYKAIEVSTKAREVIGGAK